MPTCNPICYRQCNLFSANYDSESDRLTRTPAEGDFIVNHSDIMNPKKHPSLLYWIRDLIIFFSNLHPPLCPIRETDSTKEKNKVGQGVRYPWGLTFTPRSPRLKLGMQGFHAMHFRVILFSYHASDFDIKQYCSEIEHCPLEWRQMRI